MIELYQAEWCPHSRAVRQRLTELGVDFVARQVEAHPEERNALRERAGVRTIPVLVLEDGRTIGGEEAILAVLEEWREPVERAREHAAQARAHAGG